MRLSDAEKVFNLLLPVLILSTALPALRKGFVLVMHSDTITKLQHVTTHSQCRDHKRGLYICHLVSLCM